MFLDVPDPIARVVRSTDIRGIAGETDSPFTLSWKAYRELLDREQDIRPTGFWDVIAQVNNLIDAVPVLESGTVNIEPGTVVRIPNIEALMGEIRVPPLFFVLADSGTVIP